MSNSNLQVLNITKEVSDGYYKRRSSPARGILVHRVGVDLRRDIVLGYDGPTICDIFSGRVDRWKDVASVTGNQNAYSFLVGGDLGSSLYDGAIWQALALGEIGNHARGFSKAYLGVALIGDFRVEPPSGSQYESAVALLAGLCRRLVIDPRHALYGHGEVEGAHDGTKAPGRHNACPGDKLPMKELRQDVLQRMQASAAETDWWFVEK